MAIYKFEYLEFSLLLILSLHSILMTDIAITYEHEYIITIIIMQIEILANLSLFANFTKIKLHLNTRPKVRVVHKTGDMRRVTYKTEPNLLLLLPTYCSFQNLYIYSQAITYYPYIILQNFTISVIMMSTIHINSSYD